MKSDRGVRMLRVPNFVKNYTAGCPDFQKVFCWVRYFYRQGYTLKITETARVSMMALKINYNLGSAFQPFSATILSAAEFYLMLKKYILAVVLSNVLMFQTSAAD